MTEAAVTVNGYDVSYTHAVEELENVVNNYPVWPGDTLSHQTAKGCEILKWIVRNGEGDWIPTALGITTLSAVKGFGLPEKL